MADLSQFIPYVAQYAPGASVPEVYHALRQAIDRFCRESRIIQEEQTAQRVLGTDTVVGTFSTDVYNGITVNGSLRYPFAEDNTSQWVLTAPAGMRPYEPETIWADDKVMQAVTIRHLDNTAGWRTKEGEPAYYTRMPEEIVRITPTHQTNIPVIKARVAFTILDDATEVDDALFENWRTAVADLALSDLYSKPDQAYTDPQASTMRFNAYRGHRSAARMQVNTGRTRTSVVPQPREWI